MFHVTSDKWVHWLSLYFWPLLRIMALVASAPILGERLVNRKIKIGLALLITFTVAPTLPATGVTLFSPAGFWLALQQIVIGTALGFTMLLSFAAVRRAGELIGLQMGLSFATFVDPATKLNMPVLARLLDVLAMLLFLTFNGHLWLISLLIDTFHTLPISGDPINSNAFLALVRAARLKFIQGVMLALPLIALLLTLNISMGMLNRMAPQLSVFVVGFPITLTLGILVIAALIPRVAPFCERLFSDLVALLTDIVSEMPTGTAR